MNAYLKEKLAKNFFLVNALVAVVSVISIGVFIFVKGVQPFFPNNTEGYYSIIDFLTGLKWSPSDVNSEAYYGIFYMIVGSILGTLGAIIIAVPVGILTAVYISELAGKRILGVILPAVELLAGIPSVLYGVFGLGVLVPFLMRHSPYYKGQSLLAVILVLSVMILPIVISISVNALSAVPKSYREGSYALGASKIYTIFRVVIPAAKSGILTGVILGVGRAIGETMAVMLVAGNPGGGLPTSIWSPIRPLTTNIALEMGYAAGLHQEMLFSTGVVLFVFIIVINIVLSRITLRLGDQNEK